MPDIPGPIYTISSKRMYDTCPKKFAFRYAYGLDGTPAPALVAGTEFHSDAEQAHSGEIEELSLPGIGYAEWVRELEEFEATAVELPIWLPLQDLQAFVHDNHQGLVGYFGGVIDMVGTHLHDGTLWLVDHKSVSRFYPFPRLYSTEQLGMYMAAWVMLGNPMPKGVVVSRVKLKTDIHDKHYTNYILKYLKDKEGVSLSATALRAIAKAMPKEPIAFSRKSKVVLRTPVKKGAMTVKSVARYNPEGYRVLSIGFMKGTLIHIEREFYTFSQEELQGIVRDFLAYVRAAQSNDEARRAPGLHCARCPFQAICEATRSLRTGSAEEEGLILGAYPAFGLVEAPVNRELIEAVRRRGT